MNARFFLGSQSLVTCLSSLCLCAPVVNSSPCLCGKFPAYKNKNGPLAEAKGRLCEQRRSLKSDRCLIGRSSLVTAAAGRGRGAAARLASRSAAGRFAAARLAAAVAVAHAVQPGMQPLAERRLAARIAAALFAAARGGAAGGFRSAARGGRGTAGRLAAAVTTTATVEQTGIGILGGGESQREGDGQTGNNGTQIHGEAPFME